LDCAADDHSEDNFPHGPQITNAGNSETRLPAPPLPPEFSASGNRLGLDEKTAQTVSMQNLTRNLQMERVKGIEPS